MQEYLAFVDEIGTDNNGGFIYRFDFTTNTDVVWGDYFNIAPAVMVPTLIPDENCLSSRAKVVFPREMVIAKKNSCFSMQDCIDGIIAMIFSELDESTLESDGEPFYLMFGEDMDSVVKKLKNVGTELTEITYVNSGDSSAIDSIIENGITYGDDDIDDYDDF